TGWVTVLTFCNPSWLCSSPFAALPSVNGTFPLPERCGSTPIKGTDPMDAAARARAESNFKQREQQKIEGVAAWEEYRAKQEASVANMKRLRALRLAQAPIRRKSRG